MYYFLPLLIYFPRLIPGIETQPWLLLLFSILGLGSAGARSEKSALVLIFFAWLAIAAVNVIATGGLAGQVAGFQLLLGPVFLWGAIARNDPPPGARAITIVTVALLLCALFELLYPDAYGTVAGLLLDRASVSNGNRGVSIFTPEPSYAAIALAYLLVLARWSAMVYGNRLLLVQLLLLLCLILTFSTYAVLLAGVILCVQRPKLFAAFAVTLTVIVIGVIAKGVDDDSSVRAVVAIARIATADFSNILASLSFIDPSLGTRVVTNAAAFQAPLIAPSGAGLGCDAVGRAVDGLRYDFAYDNEVLRSGLLSGCLKPPSYLACVVLAFGWFAIPFVLLLVLLTRKCIGSMSRGAPWILPLALAVVIFVVQGQVTNPVPWFLAFIGIAGYAPRPDKTGSD